MITITHARSAFGGKLVLSREFFNRKTGDYIHIEAHEEDRPGGFAVAFWVPGGNDGSHGFGGDLHHVVRCMQEYVPPPGFVEMKIPDDARC